MYFIPDRNSVTGTFTKGGIYVGGLDENYAFMVYPDDDGESRLCRLGGDAHFMMEAPWYYTRFYFKAKLIALLIQKGVL